MATEVKLPDVGEGIESGTVVSVLVKPGDKIQKDQPLLELETDKAVVEVPSTAAGVVQTVNVKEGDEAPIGAVLVVVDEAGAAAEPAQAEQPREAQGAETQAEEAPPDGKQAAEKPAEEASSRPSQPAQEPTGGGKEPAQPSGQAGGDRPARVAAASDRSEDDNGRLVPAAPSVRRLARELGVDLRRVPGSGILGRVSASDVRQAASGTERAPAGAAVAAPPLPDFSRWGEVEREPMSGIRKATVRSMSTAWSTVPMVTHFDEADVTDLERFRKRYQKEADKQGVKLTPTAILLKVVAVALRRFPDFNASIDVAKLEIVRKQYVNVGVAVDTDAGLLVPVVKGADGKGIIELARELGELAEKARNRKLSLEEMQGGNFSISNLGGIGGTNFTPIVNPPDVAILGVSRAAVKPVWDEGTGSFQPRTIMPLALTYDHRLIDGAAAARFLRWVCTALEEPFVALLDG
ncbi:MAG TPA: 2-oxo acid dehydrogenase subunit E2 [Trueperaceae bacterium]